MPVTVSKSRHKSSGPKHFASGPLEADSVLVGTDRARETADHRALSSSAQVVSSEVMALCQHMVGDGFEPGCPPELDPLADRADMVMTLSDGLVLEVRLLFDGTAGPRLVPYERDEVLATARLARTYTDAAWGIEGKVRVSFWLVGGFDAAEVASVRGRLGTRRAGVDGVVVDVWHVAPGHGVETGRPLGGQIDDALIVNEWATNPEPPRPDLEPAPHPLVSIGWLFFALAFAAAFACQQVLHTGPRTGLLALSPGMAHALGGADASLFGEWYRLCTSMFLHDGLLHLGGNLITLALTAAVAERLAGRLQTAAVLCTGGAAGALVAAAFAGSSVVAVGASGGIVAVLVFASAATALRPHRRLRALAVGRLRIVLLLAIIATVGGGRVAAWSHAAGALTGTAWVLVSASLWRPRAHPVLRRASAVIVAAFVACVGWGMVELRADFTDRVAALEALDGLMPDADLQRLRGSSMATAEETVRIYPDDPRVHYVLAHQRLAQMQFAAALESSGEALRLLDPLDELFPSGTLEGAIRQVRVLAAEAGGIDGVIPRERGALCGELRDTESGAWAAERGLCE